MVIHRPDGSKEYRLKLAEEKHGKQIATLIKMGWGDRAIGAYLGIDQWTIGRLRKKLISKNELPVSF